jgi:hypothetical protein
MVTWSQVKAFGHGVVREDAIRLDCDSDCRFTMKELREHFPTRTAA